jgi:hypothetical protein
MTYYPLNRMTTESSSDKITIVLNKLIYCLFKDEILSNNTTLRGLYLVKSYSDCYTVVFEMDGHYRNEDILINILVLTVDKILEWCDITDRYNLDVQYVTRGRRPTNINYYELMFNSYVNNTSRGYNRDGVDNFHPRFEKMRRWMHYKKPREYQSGMSGAYDPYRYRGNVQAQELVQQRVRFGELDHPQYGQRQRSIGIQPGEYNVMVGYEGLPQQIQDQQRELMRGQMSLRWSDYETKNPCAEIELPNVVVTQRATKSKISEFFKKLKL